MKVNSLTFVEYARQLLRILFLLRVNPATSLKSTMESPQTVNDSTLRMEDELFSHENPNIIAIKTPKRKNRRCPVRKSGREVPQVTRSKDYLRLTHNDCGVGDDTSSQGSRYLPFFCLRASHGSLLRRKPAAKGLYSRGNSFQYAVH
jgi:hypothetical protein